MELADRQRIAQHESAHCVVALAQGRRVTHVGIDSGHTDIEPAPAEPGIHAAVEAASILLAGEVVDPAEGLALKAEGTDWDRAYLVAKSSVAQEHVNDLMRAARRRAEALLEAHTELYEQLTAELVERGSLDAEQITQLQERQPA